MTFVDTNVLIRLMTDDIPRLRAQAEAWLQAHAADELLIPDICLAELFFVLQNNPHYKFPRARVCTLLRELLQCPQFFTTGHGLQALDIAEQHPRLDFTDCLLAVYSERQQSQLLSFDKGLRKTLA